MYTKTRLRLSRGAVLGFLLSATAIAYVSRPLDAQSPAPTLVDPNLDVRVAASGFVTPVSVDFLGTNEMLVLEKNTGRVQHVLNGALQNTAIDLAVTLVAASTSVHSAGDRRG